MKTFKKNYNSTKKSLIITLFILATALFACFGLSLSSAKAVDTINASLFMPVTPLEFDKSLSTPQDVYFDDDVVAVIQNSNELLISLGGNQFVKSGATFTSLQQVKRLSDRYLLVSDEAKICAIDLADNKTPYGTTILNYADVDGGGNVTGNFFDYKNGVLVCNFSKLAIISTLDEQTLIAHNKTSISGPTNNTPICLGDEYVFYINGSANLAMRSLTNITEDGVDIVQLSPQKMIAKGDYIYANNGNTIYRVSVSTKHAEQLNFVSDTNYQLSNVDVISGFCFKDDNLLITDSNSHTVQEFRVEGNNLVFTGYAIADGKTAFNRFGDNIQDIQKNGRKLATLDTVNGLFTLVNDTTGSFYSRDNFKYSVKLGADEFINFTPDIFALGNKSVLFISTLDQKAKLYDISKDTAKLSNEIDFSKNSNLAQSITDVTWQNGNYYVVQNSAYDGFKITIYTANEDALLAIMNDAKGDKQLSLTQFESFFSKNTNEYNVAKPPIINVDVFGNVYMTNSDGYVYKYENTANGLDTVGVKLDYGATTNVTKISTDLAGGLFVLENNDIVYYDQSSNTKLILEIGAISADITSFAMSTDSSDVYLSFDGEQYIYKTTDMPTYTLDMITAPSEFVLSTSVAKPIGDLKTFTAKNGCGVYSFNYENKDGVKKITYDKLTEIKEPLILLCQLPLSVKKTYANGAIDRQEEFYILTGKNEDGNLSTVIINAKDAVPMDIKISDAPTEYAYTTTGVSMYYLPIITKNADHILRDGDKNVILDRNTKLTVIKAVTLFDVNYYYATATVNEKTYTGYIPELFTAKILSKDYLQEKFSISSTIACAVYTDAGMTVKLQDLAENTTIRLYEENNGVCRIAFMVENDWVVGYVNSSSVVVPENNSLRNILIILAVTVSICVTSIFFILKKKQ